MVDFFINGICGYLKILVNKFVFGLLVNVDVVVIGYVKDL